MMHSRTLHLFLVISTTVSVCLLNFGQRALTSDISATHDDEHQPRHQISLALKSFATATAKKKAASAKKEASVTQDILLDKTVSRQRRPRPPLESIVQGYNITGDASWLLDFSIIGFPKCGTSTLMFHLQSHPQIAMFSDERCDMSYNKQALLARDLYTNFSAADQEEDDDDGLRRGIKCPMDLENTKLAMPNYQRYFPKTNYIVGIRHPVLWFESFYNFRIHNKFPILPPEKLVGRCVRKGFNVCTFRANFHLFLSNLNKTRMASDPNEQQYIGAPFRRSMSPVRVPQKVFLYEVRQLSDPDPQRAALFRRDLQTFLALQQPIPDIPWYKPGIKHENNATLERINSKKIDICDPTHDPVRQQLMKQAVNASRWIRQYFVPAPDVVVSSPDYFSNTLLKSWERDPCIERRRQKRKQESSSSSSLLSKQAVAS